MYIGTQQGDLYNQQAEIMAKMDFARVHKTMQLLNWTWIGAAPTVEDIVRRAGELMVDTIDRYLQAPDDWTSTQSGGLKAMILIIKGRPMLSLEFIVAHADASTYY